MLALQKAFLHGMTLSLQDSGKAIMQVFTAMIERYLSVSQLTQISMLRPLRFLT